MLRSLHFCRDTAAHRSLNRPFSARSSLQAYKSATAARRRNLSTVTDTQTTQDLVYEGPLTATFRRLKIFSLSSLTLSFVLSPFLFMLETSSGLPLSARFFLAGVAVSTSGVSTALVAWCGQPYVTRLERLPGTQGGIAMTTLTLALNKRITRVYDTAFLVETSRPLAKWELASHLRLDGQNEERTIPGDEETVAETTDANGGLIGRWVVKWGENGEGTCREVGKMNRHFNVHEELLPSNIR